MLPTIPALRYLHQLSYPCTPASKGYKFLPIYNGPQTAYNTFYSFFPNLIPAMISMYCNVFNFTSALSVMILFDGIPIL